MYKIGFGQPNLRCTADCCTLCCSALKHYKSKDPIWTYYYYHSNSTLMHDRSYVYKHMSRIKLCAWHYSKDFIPIEHWRLIETWPA